MWHKAELVLDGLFLAVSGAWGAVWYVDVWITPGVSKLHQFREDIWFVWIILMMFRSFVQIRKPQSDIELREPSPEFFASAVVLLTGCSAAYFIGREGIELDGRGIYWAALIIFAGSVLAAFAIGLWAYRHANEIGEARFPSDR